MIPTGGEIRSPVSVLILTYNEEANIAACLETLKWAGEVFVVDALSTDRTVDHARRMGAKVYSHPFEGYAKQRNWALDHLPLAYDWVLVLDADERIPVPLAGEIARVIRDPSNPYTGFYLDRRFFFMERWLKRGGLSPNWILRLFSRHAGRFEDRPLNEHLLLNGEASYLKHPFDHIDFRSLSTWIAKHNRYADLQVEDQLGDQAGAFAKALQPSLSGSPVQKKRWIRRHLWNHLPLLSRPFFLFFRNYFLKGGFLDGRAGFIYHVLWSFWFHFLVDTKILERRRAGARGAVSGINVPDNMRGELGSLAEEVESRHGR